MAKRNWESNPWLWFGMIVGAGVVTAVVSNALSKWWGLMKLEQQRLISAQAQTGQNLGKYRTVYA